VKQGFAKLATKKKVTVRGGRVLGDGAANERISVEKGDTPRKVGKGGGEGRCPRRKIL